MARQERTPAVVAQVGRTLRGIHEVGKEDGRKNAVGLRRRPHTRYELLDLVHDLVGVNPGHVVRARQLDKPCAGDSLGDVPAFLHIRIEVARPVQDKRGHLDRRQDLANVGYAVHQDEVPRCPRAGRRPRPRRPPTRHRLIGAGAHTAHVRLPTPILLDLFGV